ncbi:MAG: hypothetical protein ACTS2F_22880 [Thainema sp.]
MPQRLGFSQWLTAALVGSALSLNGCGSTPPAADTAPSEPTTSGVPAVEPNSSASAPPTDKDSPEPDATQPVLDPSSAPAEAPSVNDELTLGAGESRLLTPAELGWVERNLPVQGRSINIDQSFWVNLRDFGEVAFVVTSAVDDPISSVNDLAIYLMSPEGELIEQLPANPDATWILWETQAVSFHLLNGFDYVIVIADYITGAGPTGSRPFPVTTVYNNEGGYFTVDAAASRSLTDRGVSTVADANTILQNELGYIP